MINPFVLKKYSALLMMSFIPLLSFVLAQIYFGFWIAVFLFLFMTLMFMILANKLLDHPFRQMTEGKGLLLINLDSTGILRPFIATIKQPYVSGFLNGKKITDVFNRKAVFNMTTPGKATATVDEKNKKISLDLNEEDFNESRLGMYHYPVLIYNDQIKSLITKDFLSNQELKVFSDHGILYLNRKVEELSGHMRDFGRYVVESLKPNFSMLANYWPYILIGVVVLLLVVLFGPSIMEAIRGSAGGAVAQAASTASTAVSPAS